MKTVSRQTLSVVALLSCVAVASVLADCVRDSTRSVEERTRRVPIVVKGVVVARGQTGQPRTFTIRVGKVLKGGNESVASAHIEIVVEDGQFNETFSLTTAGLTSNRTGTERTILAGDVGGTEGTPTGGGLASTAPERNIGPCLEGLSLLSRSIFFLMPMDEEGTVFEVVEDAVPQSRENLRRIRQTVKEEESNANETLPDDDHMGSCTDAVYDNHYCLNGGTCRVWINLDKYFCICHYPYYGERCDAIDPGASTDGKPTVINDTTLAIAVIMSTLLVLTVICVIAFIKYKNNLWRERKREVEKTVKYLQERYPSTPSRRNSPVQGIPRLNNNSSNAVDVGASHVIVFQDADGKHSRQGSLSSNQYRLLTEATPNQPLPHRGSADFTDRMSHWEY
ncbi:uncharacterized protein LOC119732453 [Patiria miniata]|uniref:EGF-like domain-containing protein n=1 Tax=Patiria miniata TaxID=46514 RepID=A0A914ADA0_PATMI|nr:uncharacterized protein LOC119732453 [Patiria miniata]